MQIAEWGHNDWSFVYPESATDDFAIWLESVAQADLGDNIAVMRDTRPLVNRLEIARRVWAAAGLDVPDDDVEALINLALSAVRHPRLLCKQMANRSTIAFRLQRRSMSVRLQTPETRQRWPSYRVAASRFAGIDRIDAGVTAYPRRLRGADNVAEYRLVAGSGRVISLARTSWDVY